MKRLPRRIFMAEFKREGIQLVTKQGLTMAEASRKLDIATRSTAHPRIEMGVGHRQDGKFPRYVEDGELTSLLFRHP